MTPQDRDRSRGKQIIDRYPQGFREQVGLVVGNTASPSLDSRERRPGDVQAQNLAARRELLLGQALFFAQLSDT